ncbi:hypothetical protein [Marinoscillum sp. MHG1-6]|uniref:hypothetical protein n=1 Tax=Marinoscillum sp. MHG1-6 TaxID=2959627 RepID=UPI002157D552|nr:hypothetical protein [Marinoscillum sp. MHG1-6]
MPKIRLTSVQCTTPDEIDKDEMYLKMNGKKIWPEGDSFYRLDTGDKVELGLEIEVQEGWNEIELWDYDYVSLNDLLGVFKFTVDSNLGQYSTSMEILEKDSTASYILFWEIV